MDICVITKDKCEYLRNYVSHDKKAVERSVPYDFPVGNTPFTQELNIPLNPIQMVKPEESEKMEVI